MMKLFPLQVLLALTAGAAALPALLGRGTPTTVTSAIISSLRYYAQWAGASYCNFNNTPGQKITCSASVCPTVWGETTSTIAVFEGGVAEIKGFVATDATRKQIIVSIRGSKGAANWLDNLDFVLGPCSLVAGCLVHSGFQEAFEEISDTVFSAVKQAKAANPYYSLIVTGHSLGGALATLSGAYLRVAGYPCDTYTYGAPRVGNDAFAEFVTAQSGADFRVTHLNDPVPLLPPELLDYSHTSPEFWLKDGDATTVNYGVKDIAVCVGIDNDNCNGGTDGLGITAHDYYFEDIGAC